VPLLVWLLLAILAITHLYKFASSTLVQVLLVGVFGLALLLYFTGHLNKFIYAFTFIYKLIAFRKAKIN
jgi:hypothetical protein